MYIINPWFFYLAEVVPKLGTALCIISSLAICLSIIGLMMCIAEGNEPISIKKYLLAFIMMFVVSILLPAEETIYKMGIASITTTENVKIAVNESKELYNFVKDEIADAAKFIIDYQKGEGKKKNDSN